MPRDEELMAAVGRMSQGILVPPNAGMQQSIPELQAEEQSFWERAMLHAVHLGGFSVGGAVKIADQLLEQWRERFGRSKACP